MLGKKGVAYSAKFKSFGVYSILKKNVPIVGIVRVKNYGR